MQVKEKTIDTLLSTPPYSLDEAVKKELLLSAVLDELVFHYENNLYYKRYCDKRGITFETVNDYEALPYIPAVAFKEMGAVLNSVPEEMIVTELNSSATSGLPSTVTIDKVTARRQVKALGLVLADRLGKARRPFLVMDVDPRKANPISMGARGAAIKGFLNLASSSEYFVRESKQGLTFDQETFANHLLQIDSGKPVIIFGFTYVVYSELIERLFSQGRQLELPPNSMLVHIGGWKKLEHKKVDRKTFNGHAEKVLGIRPDHVVDFYGFTEQMGVTYPDCQCGWKHTPAFSEILIRNPGDLSVLNQGREGLIELITPIPHSYPGNVILTDDMGIVAPSDEAPCAYGREGSRFKVIGRAKKSEPRGCGDVMAHKMVFQEQTYTNDSDEIRLLFPRQGENKNLTLSELEEKMQEVRNAWSWLQRQKIDLLIGLIDRVAQKWTEQGFELKELQQQGLSFLANWCRAENLKGLADRAFKKRGYLDHFLTLDDKTRKFMKALPRGLAIHWLSGNVPVLGMLVLIQTIISKNVNILKASHSYSEALPLLLKSFENETYTSPGGETIRGNDLLKTVLVIYFPRENQETARYLSSQADIRIAWGGREAVNAVSRLPRKYTAEDILFGPKLSFMVVGKESLSDGRKLRKIIKRASVDSSVFDQTACASPHTIFVEKGGEVDAPAFASRLAQEMEKTAHRIPPAPVDNQTRNNIESRRVTYDFVGDLWCSQDHSWTVLYDENLSLAAPTYGRVITVKGIEDVFQTIDLIDENIQTVSLALQGKRRLDYASRAAAEGAIRFPEIGEMTHFEDPWDGLFVLQRSVRWASLGGPH